MCLTTFHVFYSSSESSVILRACFAIEPNVGDHPMHGRVSPCGQGGVVYYCFCVGMPMVCVGKYRAIFQQIIEAVISHARAEAVDQVTTELVNCDLEDHSWFFLRMSRDAK
jgi:hypothetical protein